MMDLFGYQRINKTSPDFVHIPPAPIIAISTGALIRLDILYFKKRTKKGLCPIN